MNNGIWNNGIAILTNTGYKQYFNYSPGERVQSQPKAQLHGYACLHSMISSNFGKANGFQKTNTLVEIHRNMVINEILG